MRRILIVILVIFSVWKVQGQDPQFSQFYSNPLYLGPSFSGAVEGSRISTSLRDQWTELATPFRVYSISYDHYFSTFNSGVGILAYKDVAGTSQLGSFNLGLMYSYNFQIFHTYHLRPGISFFYLEHGFYGDLLFMDEIVQQGGGTTGAALPARDRAYNIDAGASALFYSKKFWLGSSVDHLFTPDISLYEVEATLPVKYSVYGGYEFRRKGQLLKPSDETMTFAFMFKKQAEVAQLDLGVYWHNYPLVLGIWYRGIPFVNSRRGDAVVFLAGLKTRSFNIGYSYDLTISNLIGAVRSSHEISITTKFLLPKRSKKGSVPCPEF
ncbi:MAG: PorP/SprF family type IX secretion system membrane protein [Bacteroidales bacterium]|nr:PorP/SprF family type IX secretion system membrane protein [Bacteroidales bacterium]